MSPDPEPPESSLPPSPPDLAAPAAAGAAAHAAHASGHHGPFHTHCENCGTKLEGPWCHRCGQHDFEFHRSFWHVFMEALETIFHFEGKFFRNIVTLLFQPGRLTAEFNAGRRAPQMPPFRLYIFVSFVFFLLVSVGDKPPSAGHTTVNTERPDSAQRVYTTENWHEALSEHLGSDAATDTSTAGPSDPADAATPPPAVEAPRPPRSGIEQFIEQLANRLSDPQKRHQLGHWIQAHIPHMMMFCLPLFALYTRVLFRKSGLVYLQHLVVSVHFHTFVYLWVLFTRGWTALAGLPGWGLDGWVAFAGNTWLCVYPVLMLRRLFAGSWPRTLLKAGLLAGAYTFTLAFGFLLTAMIAYFFAV